MRTDRWYYANWTISPFAETAQVGIDSRVPEWFENCAFHWLSSPDNIYDLVAVVSNVTVPQCKDEAAAARLAFPGPIFASPCCYEPSWTWRVRDTSCPSIVSTPADPYTFHLSNTVRRFYNATPRPSTISYQNALLCVFLLNYGVCLKGKHWLITWVYNNWYLYNISMALLGRILSVYTHNIYAAMLFS